MSALSISFCMVNYEISFLFQKIGLIQLYLEGLCGEELQGLCRQMQRNFNHSASQRLTGQAMDLYWALGHFLDMEFLTHPCDPYLKSCSVPHQFTSSGGRKCFKYIFLPTLLFQHLSLRYSSQIWHLNLVGNFTKIKRFQIHFFKNHRIIEYLQLERTHEDHQGQFPVQHRTP